MYVSNRFQRNKDWSSYSEERLEKLGSELQKESKDFILNVNEEKYTGFLYEKYQLEPLLFDEDTIRVYEPRKEERQLTEEDRRYERNLYYWSCSIDCQVEGTDELWGVRPSVWGFGGQPDFAVSGNTLTFVFKIQSQNVDEFNRQKNESIQWFRNHVMRVNHDVSSFNIDLSNRTKVLFGRLKASYLQDNSFFASINVTPNPNAPQTYAVPKIERRPTIQKPTITSKAFTSEPTVDNKAYGDIIECLQRTGLSIERKPSLYVNKDEEALRDLFLVQLELAFTGGTVTGETFNRSGKTDILLKNIDNTNLFVGECKVWKGPKHYLEALSQLLEYLTWDDSKTALVVFVTNVTLSSVIQAVKESTLKHQAAIKLVEIRSDRFFHFTFALPQDNQKHVAIQVMLFHFDKAAEGRMH